MAYLEPGNILADRYRIEREIGRGGYSVVYRATDLTLDVPIGLKLLVPPPAAEAVARERMRREAIVARGLSHPNVVALHDFVDADGRSFLTMELVDGPDLAACVAASGPLPVGQAVSMARDIAAALGAAHATGVLHRDVKPQNVLLEADGRARLTDFGSARMVEMSTVTRTGGLVGTIGYTAPEVVAGERGDPRADLYALGMTLYYGLTGVLPDQRSPHLPPHPSPVGFRPRGLRPDAPGWLDNVTAILTREDPGLRFPTAGALLEALETREGESRGLAGAAALRRECVLCGDADPIGAGLCSVCLGASGTDSGRERLLFVERGKNRSQQKEIEDWLEDVAGDEVSAGDVAATRRGELPLASVPIETGPRVARHLRQLGIPVQITHPANLPGRLSSRLQVLLSTAVVLGLAAGATAPIMFLVTPAFAGTVLVAALRRQSRHFLSGGGPAQLAPETEAHARSALSAMAEGTAHRLFADFVRMARVVRPRDGGGPSAEDLDALIRSAGKLAAELEALDAGLAIIERQAIHHAGAPDEAWLESHARVLRTRDRLVQRLLDALAALARTRAAGSEAALTDVNDLAELAREMERDAELQAEARREVEALLG